MAKILDFSSFPKPIDDLKEMEINELLAHAVLVREKTPPITEGLMKIDPRGLKRLFEGTIFNILLKNRLTETTFLFCGIYVADLLTNLAHTTPPSWFAIDYMLQQTAEATKQGANLCFAICAIFRARGSIRCMSLKDYEQMGAGLYYRFYLETGSSVGLSMSQEFSTMTEVARECLNSLKD
jgi:hypothetical protein